MLITYEIPRATIADIQDRLHKVDGMSVKLSNEVEAGDEHFEAILEIEFNFLHYQLPILRPSDSDSPLLFKCWLFSGADFNPLNPIAWFRWIAVERKQLSDLEGILEDAIGLTPHLTSTLVQDCRPNG